MKRTILLIILLMSSSCIAVNAQDLRRTTFYNNQGQGIGYSTNNGYTTYYYDKNHKLIGKSE